MKDPIDILQSAYSLAQFDLPLYLRFEAHADSLDHFVTDLETADKYIRIQEVEPTLGQGFY